MENKRLTCVKDGHELPSKYSFVKSIGYDILVRSPDNKLELWKPLNGSSSTYHLNHDGKKYEFSSDDKNKIKQIITEMSATGAVAGYATPYAFSKGGEGNKKAAETVGYKLVKEEPEKEVLGEGKYSNYKKHPMKNEAKISLSLREVNKLLREIENLVNFNSRLKTESKVNGTYWSRSAKDVSQIKERTKNIVRGIKEIVKGKLNEISEPSSEPIVGTEPVLVQQKSNPATPEKLYTISIDFLNFENELSGVINKHTNIIKKKVINKEVTVRASKGYGQVEKDYTLLVKGVSIVAYKEKYNLIFKDQNKKEYYVNTTFKLKVKQSIEASQPITQNQQPILGK